MRKRTVFEEQQTFSSINKTLEKLITRKLLSLLNSVTIGNEVMIRLVENVKYWYSTSSD